MTPADLLSAAQAKVEAVGPRAFVQLIVPRKRSPANWDSITVWVGGPRGRVVGEVSRGRYLVEVRAADVIEAVGRLEKQCK